MARTPKVIAVEGVEPVTLAEARAHIEAQAYEDSDVDPTDDAMIEGWIAAAREHCEDFLGLSLVTKTLEIAMDTFPVSTDMGGTAIDLPGGPVREIVQIMVPPPETEYTSDDVDSDTAADEPIWADGQLNPDLYVLDDYRQPNQVKPATAGAAWPSIVAAPNAIKVRYLVGYGVDSDGGAALPATIRAAVLLVIGHLYLNREATTDKALATLPLGVESLLRPKRVRLGMA
jgi:uncharacterized phiE125 gp8 family phage protein